MNVNVNVPFNLDPSTVPIELNLMLEMLRADAGPGARRPQKRSLPNIDWNQLLHLVRHHRVYPQIYANAGGGLIPSDVLQAVERDYRRNTLEMLRLSGESVRVCRELAGRDVRSLALKGPAIAVLLYGDVSHRTSKDLDILVPLADVLQAEAVLEELGYRADKPISRVTGDWKWKIHHTSFTHPQTRVQVELHWRLNGEGGKEPSFEELWAARQSSGLADGLDTLGNEHLMLYLAAHGARHAWFRLRWLTDIDRLARRRLDWEKLAALLRRYQSRDLAGQALALAFALLHTPVPHAMRPIVVSGRGSELALRAMPFIREPVHPQSDELDGTYKRYLFALKTTPQKWRFAASRLLPSFRDAEALPLPRPLYFLYYPLRPFVWLWRQVRQQT